MKHQELEEPTNHPRFPKVAYRFRSFEEADEWTDYHLKLSALEERPWKTIRRFKLNVTHALRVLRMRYFSCLNQ